MRFDPLIFTPGYSNLEESIKNTMLHLPMHHREEKFKIHFKSCKEKLKKILNMEEIIMLSCSGSGAMEACVSTFCNNPLCINSGKFGKRYIDIAKTLKIDFVSINTPSNISPTIEEISNTIKQNKKIDSICMQICESSSGLRHSIESILKEIKKIDSNILTIVDGIASIGAEKISTAYIDVLIASPSKAFGIPPGLSIIGFNNLAKRVMQERNKRSFYFDLHRELLLSYENTTSFTPSTSSIIALDKYLEALNLDDLYCHIYASAIATRKSLQAIGLKIYPETPSISMSVIYSENSRMIIELLEKEYNIKIANGQDELRDKVFRISHMGGIPLYKLLWLINAIELVLNKLNIRKFNGCSNRIFLDSYYEAYENYKANLK